MQQISLLGYARRWSSENHRISALQVTSWLMARTLFGQLTGSAQKKGPGLLPAPACSTLAPGNSLPPPATRPPPPAPPPHHASPGSSPAPPRRLFRFSNPARLA